MLNDCFSFLSVNRFGELRDDNDPNCTYEGDNNMLLWQSSSYLLSLLEAKQKGKLQYTITSSHSRNVRFQR